MSELGQRLRRLELELLETFDGGTLQLEHARRAVAEIEELCTLRAAGALQVDATVLFALGMVCAALLFVLRCAIDGEQRRRSSSSAPTDDRCGAIYRGPLTPTNGNRCTLRVGHGGGHVYGGIFPRQCDARRPTTSGPGLQRCRLLHAHDGDHIYDDDDNERGST